MKLKLFDQGETLHGQFGIEPDRKAALHTYAFKVYREGGSKSENMAHLAEICEDANELAYLMFHYGFICASQEQGKRKGSSFSGFKVEKGHLHDLPEFLQDFIAELLGDDEDDDERRRHWREGMLSCGCAQCRKIRMEMEKKFNAKKARPDLN